MTWGGVVIATDGDALTGEISDGDFFVRRHPNSTPVPVSSSFWFFSLNYSFATFGLTPLALAIIFVFSRPSWDRGYLDVVAISLGLLWLLAITSEAVPRWCAWAAI
jgi:hypothetical protein